MHEKSENNSEMKKTLPKNLTPRDIELVVEQCKIQNATTGEQIEGFANAYSVAKECALDEQKLNSLSSEQTEELILQLGTLTERCNEKGFRQVPVTFMNGSRALDSEKIQRAINNFCQGFVTFLKDPTEDERFNITLLYTEFEKIHPFEDGNGRVGDLLWKILKTKKDGKWPEELPPDVFNEEKKN